MFLPGNIHWDDIVQNIFGRYNYETMGDDGLCGRSKQMTNKKSNKTETNKTTTTKLCVPGNGKSETLQFEKESGVETDASSVLLS